MARVKCWARLGRLQGKSGLIRTEYIRFRGQVACDLCGRSTYALLYVRGRYRIDPERWGYTCYCKECAKEVLDLVSGTLKEADKNEKEELSLFD